MNDDAPNDPRPPGDNSDVPDFIRQKEPADHEFEHETFSSPQPKNLPLALGVGAVVAALGGVAWALVVVLLEVEVGMLAWGIGLVVGGAIMAIAKNGDLRLGVSAAGIALFGLILGKVLIAQFGLAHGAVDTILEDQDLLYDAVYYDMEQHDEVDPEVASYYENATDQSRPGPALDQKVMRTQAELASRVENMGEDERKTVAKAYADHALGEVAFTERMGFSGWDLLWLGLAVYTAFRICATGRREEFA